MATISGLIKIIGHFCKRALQKRRYSAKETYNLIDPTDRSHPIHEMTIEMCIFAQRHELHSVLAYLLYSRAFSRVNSLLYSPNTMTFELTVEQCHELHSARAVFAGIYTIYPYSIYLLVYIQYVYTICVYNMCIQYMYTICGYTICIQLVYTIYVCNIHIQYVYTICVYNICIQYMYTIYVYNMCIQYVYTIYVYNICIQYVYTIYVCNICIQYIRIQYMYTIARKYVLYTYIEYNIYKQYIFASIYSVHVYKSPRRMELHSARAIFVIKTLECNFSNVSSSQFMWQIVQRADF